MCSYVYSCVLYVYRVLLVYIDKEYLYRSALGFAISFTVVVFAVVFIVLTVYVCVLILYRERERCGLYRRPSVYSVITYVIGMLV